MGSSGLKEIHVSGSLYQAYKDQLIPPSPSFDDFAKSHKAFQDRAMRTGMLGMLLMPAVTFYLYKTMKTPSIRGGFGLGFCTFFVLFVMPSRPPAEEMAFVRKEGPKYLHILIKKDPQAEPLFREILGTVPAEGSFADSNPISSPKTSFSDYREPRGKHAEQPWEQRTPAESSWKEVDRKEKAESPYLSPDKSERPYVYGSLSAPREGKDARDRPGF